MIMFVKIWILSLRELEKLVLRAKENDAVGEVLSKEEILEIEPNITKDVLKALYAPSAGIINPFELVVALMENTIDNGVKLKLNDEVIDIKRNELGYEVITKNQS